MQQSRATVLLLAGLLLVAVNAIVAGHWLNLKNALVDAAGSGPDGLPSISLPGAGIVKDVGKGVKKGRSIGNWFDDPIAGHGAGTGPGGTPLTKEVQREIMVGVRGVGSLFGGHH